MDHHAEVIRAGTRSLVYILGRLIRESTDGVINSKIGTVINNHIAEIDPMIYVNRICWPSVATYEDTNDL